MNVLRKASNDKLLNFVCAINEKYQINWHHQVIAKALEETFTKVAKGKKARLIIEVPPRHGKTELATINFPAWVMGKKPEWNTIVSSYSETLAETFGQKTRDIMQDERYAAIFDTELRQDTQAKGNWMTKQKGSYIATGIGGAITGRGFNIGIIDDPIKNREDAESEIKRDVVWNWYTSTFSTRQEGNGAIIIILTRWHHDDLVGRLLRKQQEDEKNGEQYYDKWDVVRLPAIAEEDEKYRKVGEALWPWKYDFENLLETKNRIGIMDWSALYQQSPAIAESAEFKKEYFKTKVLEPYEMATWNFTTTVDPAISQRDSADRTVVCSVGREPGTPNWYVYITSGRFDPLQTIDVIFKHATRFRSRVWIESVAYQKALKYFIEEEQRRTGNYFIVEEIKKRRQSKEATIRGLIPLYRTGVIYHMEGCSMLEDELQMFPFGVHDDHPDALAMQLEVTTMVTDTSKPNTRTFHTYDNLHSGI